MINCCVIEGRLTADPEERRTQNGTLILSGTLANQRNFKNKEGGYDTNFIRYCVIGEDRAMFFKKTFRKGMKAVVTGEWRVNQTKGSDGNRKDFNELDILSWSYPELKRENQIKTNAEMDDRLEAQMKELADDSCGDLPF